MSSLIKKRSLYAVIWSGIDLFIRQGFQFVVAIVLARILSPEEFGTIALLYIFIDLGSTIVDSGFSSALIQKKNTTNSDESTVFWFNVACGAAISVGVYFSAPIIVRLFELPILEPLVQVLSFTIFIKSLSAVHQTLLIKQLEFKAIMKVGVGSSFISGVIAIYLASENYGVWALAAQVVSSSLLSTMLLWYFSRWRPKCVFSLSSLKELFGFGGFIMAAGILDVIFNRIYAIVIGKLYGVAELGFYSRADNTKQIPVKFLSGLLARVAFPIFSEVASEQAKLIKGIKVAISGIMLINIPIMFGIIATADNLVDVLFGEKWSSSVTLLKILCLAGVFWPLHVINLNVLKAQGYAKLFFRLEIIKKVVGIFYIFVGSYYYGVIGLAWSQVLFGLTSFYINAYFTGVHLQYGAWEQIKDFVSAIGVSVVMMFVVIVLSPYLSSTPFVKLITQIFIGFLSYFIMCFIFRIKVLTVVKGLLK